LQSHDRKEEKYLLWSTSVKYYKIMKNGSLVPPNKYIIISLGFYKIGSSVIIYKWFSDINVILKKEMSRNSGGYFWLYDSLTVFFLLANKIVLKILLLFEQKELSGVIPHASP